MKTIYILAVISLACVFTNCQSKTNKTAATQQWPELLIRPQIIGPENEMAYMLDQYTAITTKLNAEVGNMLKLPKVQEQWARYGAAPVSMTPAQVTEHVRSEISKFAVVVKASGARID